MDGLPCTCRRIVNLEHCTPTTHDQNMLQGVRRQRQSWLLIDCFPPHPPTPSTHAPPPLSNIVAARTSGVVVVVVSRACTDAGREVVPLLRQSEHAPLGILHLTPHSIHRHIHVTLLSTRATTPGCSWPFQQRVMSAVCGVMAVRTPTIPESSTWSSRRHRWPRSLRRRTPRPSTPGAAANRSCPHPASASP